MDFTRLALVAAVASFVAACTATKPEATPTNAPIFGAEGSPPAGLQSPPASTQPAGTSVPPATRVTPTLLRTLPPTDCLNGASFVEDLTIPDGSQVLPGESLDKRWSVRNSGTCDWGADYRLVQVGSSEIHGPGETALYPAAAGSVAVWQVALTAPTDPGEYLARWQARAPDGALFGDEVFVLILVAEPEPTDTPDQTATP